MPSVVRSPYLVVSIATAAGTPARHALPGVLELQPGQWDRVRYHARVSRDWVQREWHYAKHGFNIGWFPIVELRVFLDTPAEKIHLQVAQLW